MFGKIGVPQGYLGINPLLGDPQANAGAAGVRAYPAKKVWELLNWVGDAPKKLTPSRESTADAFGALAWPAKRLVAAVTGRPQDGVAPPASLFPTSTPEHRWNLGMMNALRDRTDPAGALGAMDYAAKAQAAMDTERAAMEDAALGMGPGGIAGALKFRRLYNRTTFDRDLRPGALRPVDDYERVVHEAYRRGDIGPYRFVREQLEARGIPFRGEQAGTGSQYIHLDTPEGPLTLRFSDHSRYAPTGNTSRAHAEGHWEFSRGLTAQDRQKLASALKLIDDLYGKGPR